MQTGTTVSHYEILERLGQGGMGTVFKARDTKLGRYVAIKVLPSGVGYEEEQRERFMQEARAASAIDHPNIGAVYEIDESAEGEPFIAMAYYEGKNLKDRIREGPLDLRECVTTGLQIARGMSEAHARGIIHRDIKPANIVITPRGLAKIIDFGLAKLTDGLQLTRTGTSLGTLAYMSPEQLKAEEIGPETDIWALGIILFEMLTGKHPFHGEFEAALMYSIANEPPLSLPAYRPDAPPALEKLVTGMLAKNRAERISSMAEVAATLEGVFPAAPAGGGGAAAPETTASGRATAAGDRAAAAPGEMSGVSSSTGTLRKLAAIMFTDMVGYSALMQKSERRAIEFLDEHRVILRRCFRRYGGREIETIGDAFLVEFDSAIHAVRSAVSIHDALNSRNAEHSPGEAILVRIGIHLGDIVERDGRVYGDGVNVASRIQGQAGPGEIVVSEDIARQLRNLPDIPLRSLGRRALKNIENPVELFSVGPQAGPAAPGTDDSGGAPHETSASAASSGVETAARAHRPAVLAGAGKRILIGAGIVAAAVAGYLLFRPPGVQRPPEALPSIAVVPFTVTGEEDLKFLGDGVSGEIAGILSRWGEMTVISRKSASVFSDAPAPDSVIANTLGVRYVMHGDIRVTIARIFIQTKLYDHERRDLVSSDSVTIDRKDLAGLPGSIASQVAALAGSDLANEAVRRPTASAGAYESYLHGSFYREQLTREAIGLARVHFGEAVALDSSYLSARLMLAGTLLEEYLQGYTRSESGLARVETICRGVLQIDSLNDGALAILGKVLDLRGNREEGLRMLNRSLEINPDNPYTLTVLGQMYIMETNEPLRGIVLLNKLRLIDPLDWLTNNNLGVAYAQSENHAEALASFRRAAALNPAHPFPAYSIGYLFEILGKPDSAEIFYRSAIGLDPTFLQAHTSLTELCLAGSRFGAAESVATAALRSIPADHSLIYLRGLSALLGNRREAADIFNEGYRLVSERLKKDPESVKFIIYSGLFAARLGRTGEASAVAGLAAKLDSTHEETAMNIARIYAAAGMKASAIEWFSRARAMNPEYDEAYLRTAIDFERLRNDPDLVLAARK